MTIWLAYALAALSFLIALCAATYAAFCYGWDLGWTERGTSMVLPESSRRRIDNAIRWRDSNGQ